MTTTTCTCTAHVECDACADLRADRDMATVRYLEAHKSFHDGASAATRGIKMMSIGQADAEYPNLTPRAAAYRRWRRSEAGRALYAAKVRAHALTRRLDRAPHGCDEAYGD